MESEPFSAIFYIDKPYRWTSFDVVNKVRWQLCRKLGVKKLKVGHAGTLDPLATGVMLVCAGRTTKRIDELQAATKEYVATLRLGATTPSFDMEHPIDATYPTEHITRELVESVLQRFVGRIEQIPPAYSAVKVDGKRAYDLARKDKDIALKAKELVIDEIELLEYSNPTPDRADCPDSPPVLTEGREQLLLKAEDTSILHLSGNRSLPSGCEEDGTKCSGWTRSGGESGRVEPGRSGEDPSHPLPRTGLRNKAFLTSPALPDDTGAHPSLTLRIVCSKGTYIRALARDIGQALGSGAFLTALRRTRVGDVRVDDCMTVDETITKINDETPRI